MEAGLIHLHNALRWVVVIAGVAAVVKAVLHIQAGKPYARGPGVAFMASLHLQLIVGFTIYFGVSGLAATFRADPGASMKVAALRFFGMEHVLMMTIATVVATIGSARAKRGADETTKNKTARTFFAVALVVLALGIPWPFRGGGVGRALFPGMTPPSATAPTAKAAPPASPTS
jgi:hypothetical protein